MSRSQILVIKLGALGDFIQALGPLKAIRDHHPDQEITLLTTRPYEELARASGTVDHIWIDDRPRIYQVGKWLALRSRLRAGQFTRVYDLQTSDRSSSYFKLFAAANKPEWSGIARGCSHPHANPGRDFMHTQDRQREQLKMADIEHTPIADMSWANGDISAFNLPKSFALLVPGGAPHRPAKRWPIDRYLVLAQHLADTGVTPVLLGTGSESVLVAPLTQVVPEAVNLVGRTSLLDIASIAKHAKIAIGNDTGPMHIIAAAGCPSVVLFSKESDPNLCAPRGAQTMILQRDDLAQLNLDDILESCPDLGAH